MKSNSQIKSKLTTTGEKIQKINVFVSETEAKRYDLLLEIEEIDEFENTDNINYENDLLAKTNDEIFITNRNTSKFTAVDGKTISCEIKLWSGNHNYIAEAIWFENDNEVYNETCDISVLGEWTYKRDTAQANELFIVNVTNLSICNVQLNDINGDCVDFCFDIINPEIVKLGREIDGDQFSDSHFVIYAYCINPNVDLKDSVLDDWNIDCSIYYDDNQNDKYFIFNVSDNEIQLVKQCLLEEVIGQKQ